MTYLIGGKSYPQVNDRLLTSFRFAEYKIILSRVLFDEEMI